MGTQEILNAMPDNPFRITPDYDAGKDRFNERMYAKKFLRHVPLRTHEDEWFVWDGKAWRRRKRAHFEPIAMNVLPDQFKAAEYAMRVMKHAGMVQQLPLETEFHGAVRFDGSGQVLINCANGVLAVSEMRATLRKHDPELLFTATLDAEWEDKEWSPAMTPLFTKVIEEALPDPQDRALQQWFAGYLLYPSCMHEVCLISYGKGGSGKSTISDAILSVLGGPPLKTVLSLSQLCGEGQSAYSLPDLRHACVNMATELDTVGVSDSANFKRIISGEPIQVRPIYGAPYPMTSCVKLWFNANSLPRFHHGTDAELRRVRFLCYSNVPKVKDETMKEKLAAERNGLLAYMVQALQEIMAGAKAPEGGAESVRLKGRFAISNDPVTSWAQQCLCFEPDEEVMKDDLYESFNGYLNSWGFPEKSKAHLFRQFYERFPAVAAYQVRTDRKREDGSKQSAGYWLKGVRLNEEKEMPPGEE